MGDVIKMPGVPGQPPSIPLGCICAYTWSYLPPYTSGLLRNGPVLSCPADHSGVDGRA